jgi:hypothetical protein
MRRQLFLFFSLVLVSSAFAQDDIYDNPEPVKPRVVYQNQSSNMDRGDGSYENMDDNFNPEYDYRYRRSLRRMYDPGYMMPSSAFLNMNTYPQFSNFYNPYWGNGFAISIGNTWGNPWGMNNWGGGWNTWNNPWGWNSWNSWHAWNNPWGMNNWGGGWNNSWCGWNNWGGGWNDPYWGGGWNNQGWAGSGRRGQRSNYTDVSGRPAYSNAQLPERNYPRANGRYQNPNNAGSTFDGNNSGNQNRGRNVNTAPSQSPSSGNSGGGAFGGGRSGSNSGSHHNSNSGSNKNSSWGGNSNTPSAPASTPSRGSSPRGGRF